MGLFSEIRLRTSSAVASMSAVSIVVIFLRACIANVTARFLVRRAEPSDWERQEYTAQQVTQFFKICAYRIENRGAGTEASSSLTIRIDQ